MKKIIFLLCCIFAAQNFVFAQELDPSYYADVTAEFGPVKKNRFGAFDDLLEQDNNGGYFTHEMLKRPNLFDLQGKYAIRHYNSKHELVNEYLLAGEDEKNVSYFSLEEYNNKYYLFSTKTSWKEKKTEVRLEIIGSDFKSEGNRQVISEMTTKGNDRGSMGRISSSDRWHSPLGSAGFTLKTSRQGSKAMLFKNTTYDYFGAEDKKEHYEMQMFDGDKNMDKMWATKVDMPYESQFFEILDGCVDEDGNFYFVGVLFADKRRNVTKDGFPNYTFKVFKFNSEGKVFESDIKLNDKFLTDLKLDISANNKLVCSGFYSNDKRTTSVNGVYFLSLNSENGSITKESTKAFDLDMLTENLTEQQAKKVEKKAAKGKDVNLTSFYFDELIPRSDGGAIIIAEQYYVRVVTTTTTSSSGAVTTRTTYYYYYNDILVINVNPEGDIEWAHKVHKKQRTQNDGGYYSSYARVNTGKELFFIFNDNGKNTPDVPTKDYKWYFGATKKAMVSLAGINQEGKVTRKLLFKSKNADTILRPKQSLQTGTNTILIQSIKKKKQQYVKLTFQ